jgi:MftR C-terminal domain
MATTTGGRRTAQAIVAAALELFADPGRRLARERLIAATPALQARRLTKTLRWEQAIAARLVERGSSEQEALLVPKLAMACFQTAYERWVRDPGRDLPRSGRRELRRPRRHRRLAGRWPGL